MAQLDPLTGQTVSPISLAAADPEAAATAPTELPPLDRRRGPRRADEPEDELPAERRQADRRKRKPGLPALLGAILADDEESTPDA